MKISRLFLFTAIGLTALALTHIFAFKADAAGNPDVAKYIITRVKETSLGITKGVPEFDFNDDKAVDVFDLCLAKQRNFELMKEVVPPVTFLGIDVSKWQGQINWQQVKASGVSFAIIRAGFGREYHQEDPYFRTNMQNAGAAGVQRGVYWYSYAKTPEDAALEAQVCLDVIRGYKFEYPIFFDIEDPSQVELGMETITAITETFCSIVASRGYHVGIYSYKNFLDNYIHPELLRRYDVWVAQWNVDMTTYDKPFTIWQYSDKGEIPGIYGDVDLNISYKDYLPVMIEKGLNGY